MHPRLAYPRNPPPPPPPRRRAARGRAAARRARTAVLVDAPSARGAAHAPVRLRVAAGVRERGVVLGAVVVRQLQDGAWERPQRGGRRLGARLRQRRHLARRDAGQEVQVKLVVREALDVNDRHAHVARVKVHGRGRVFDAQHRLLQREGVAADADAGGSGGRAGRSAAVGSSSGGHGGEAAPQRTHYSQRRSRAAKDTRRATREAAPQRTHYSQRGPGSLCGEASESDTRGLRPREAVAAGVVQHNTFSFVWCCERMRVARNTAAAYLDRYTHVPRGTLQPAHRSWSPHCFSADTQLTCVATCVSVRRCDDREHTGDARRPARTGAAVTCARPCALSPRLPPRRRLPAPLRRPFWT
jgi:hypothetical protein